MSPSIDFRPSDFIGIISFDAFLTGVGFEFAAGVVALSSTAGFARPLSISGGLLLLLALGAWRLRNIIKGLVNRLIESQQST